MKISVKNAPMRVRLLVAVMFAAFFAAFAFFGCFIAFEAVQQRRALARDLALTAKLIGEWSTEPLLNGDEEAAARILSSLRNNENVAYASVYSEENNFKVDYFRDGDGSDNTGLSASGAASDSMEADAVDSGSIFNLFNFDVFQPISVDGENIGRVRLKVDLAEAYAASRLYVLTGACIFFLSFLSSWLLSLKLGRLISLPTTSPKDGKDLFHRDDSCGEADAAQTAQLSETMKSLEPFGAELQKFNAADQLKPHLLANISREIRTPLNGILGSLELLLNAGSLADEQKMYVQTAIDSASALSRLLNGVVDLSKRDEEKNASGLRDGPVFSASILLVEDDEVNRNIAREILTLMGCRVDVAADGFGGVDKWSKGKYDLILMDCQLPLMDGYEAAALIREAERSSNLGKTPIIALTGHRGQAAREKCFAAGMDDYLAKPFTSAELSSALVRRLPPGLVSQRKVKDAQVEQDGDGADAAGFSSCEPSEMHVDPAALKTIEAIQEEGETSLVAEAVNIYLEDTPKIIQEIRQAATASNPKAMRRAAHKLKSSSAALGAKLLADECRRIEEMGDSHVPSEAGVLLEEIEAEYELVSSLLAAKCKEYRI